MISDRFKAANPVSGEVSLKPSRTQTPPSSTSTSTDNPSMEYTPEPWRILEDVSSNAWIVVGDSPITLRMGNDLGVVEDGLRFAVT